MTSYFFHDAPSQLHQAGQRAGVVHVGDTAQRVRSLGGHGFATPIAGRSARLHAVADGDTIHLQLNGRTCRLERVDATRGAAGASAAGSGAATAPMPGVVVSWAAQPGSTVAAGAALLVIESMKLQMTIEAPQAGVLEELPLQPGQTFPRGAVLARVRGEGAQE